MANRVRTAADVVVLLTPRDSGAERVGSVLYRRVGRLESPGGPILRETQRYVSQIASRPGDSYDTLDVSFQHVAADPFVLCRQRHGHSM